jgi:hypothetical protein
MLGVRRSKETKRKMSESHIGLKHSIASRRKMSFVQKGRFVSEGSKQKNRIAHLGKVTSLATRRKLGFVMKRVFASSVVKRKHRLAVKAAWAKRKQEVEV